MAHGGFEEDVDHASLPSLRTTRTHVSLGKLNSGSATSVAFPASRDSNAASGSETVAHEAFVSCAIGSAAVDVKREGSRYSLSARHRRPSLSETTSKCSTGTSRHWPLSASTMHSLARLYPAMSARLTRWRLTLSMDACVAAR